MKKRLVRDWGFVLIMVVLVALPRAFLTSWKGTLVMIAAGVVVGLLGRLLDSRSLKKGTHPGP